MISLHNRGPKPKLGRECWTCACCTQNITQCVHCTRGRESYTTATTDFSTETWIQVSCTQFNFPICNLSEPKHLERECFLSCIESDQEIMGYFAIFNVENGTQDLTHANDLSAKTPASRIFFTVETSYFISICSLYIIMDFILMFSCLYLMYSLCPLSCVFHFPPLLMPFHSQLTPLLFSSLWVFVCLGVHCVCERGGCQCALICAHVYASLDLHCGYLQKTMVCSQDFFYNTRSISLQKTLSLPSPTDYI